MSGVPELAAPLRVEDTVEVDVVRHRLALGVQWLDALGGQPASGAWTVLLETIGVRACPLRFDAHPQSRQALAWGGLLARILAKAAAEKTATPPATPAVDPTRFNLRAFAQRDPAAGAYAADEDPRHFVPRRLSLIPVQDAGVPSAGTGNSRQAWLWPGAAYPLVSNATALRGCVRRGTSPANALPVPWARVVITARGGGIPDFDADPHVGWAHVDDRGEFLAVLGVDAVPGGAALPAQLALDAWVFLPPPAAPDPDDSLAALPTEVAGIDSLNDVLRGIQPPAGYVRQAPIGVSVQPGEVLVMNDSLLLFT